MPRQSVVARVERLEKRVTLLEELPGRVDAPSTQISQLREEMHREFSNVGDEIRAGDERLMNEIRASHERLLNEIRAGNEQIMSHARVLYEDLRADWANMQKGRPPQQPPGKGPPQK